VDIKIEKSWKKALESEFAKPYFISLIDYIQSEIKLGKDIYPSDDLLFNAFEKTPIDRVKVVILGQDPYHNPGEAMGLSFSVPKTKKIPPSLRNIYKELHEDLGAPIPTHGDLTSWAEEGVFLLNAMLTVEHKKAGAHRKSGWQDFTDAVISTLSESQEGLVFMLWGNFAKQKQTLIDADRHLILTAAHPSPLARGAYFGSKHFSKANDYLENKGIKGINWEIPK